MNPRPTILLRQILMGALLALLPAAANAQTVTRGP